METNKNTKLEVAIEILAAKIALVAKEGYTVKDEQIRKLLLEREEMYLGNEEIIEKILTVYGPEIKANYEGECE